MDYGFIEHWIARLEYELFQILDEQKFAIRRRFGRLSPVAAGSCITGGGMVGFNLSEAKATIAYKF